MFRSRSWFSGAWKKPKTVYQRNTAVSECNRGLLVEEKYSSSVFHTNMSYRKSKSSQNNSNISVATYICSIIELSCHCSSGERFAQLHQQVPERPGSYRLLVLLPMNSDV
ncbi:hypothetical protein GQX74_013521 [Glossina fuscipes]|nr:hypothetical protein GQX74_013521 [Glossina fuscipes]